MKPSNQPDRHPTQRELGVVVRRSIYERANPILAQGIEWMEEVEAGGDSSAVGQWMWTVYLKNGEWFAEVECSYGIGGVVQIGGELDGLEFLGPIDFATLDKMIGPFSSREEAVAAVATRLLACVALLSGMWEPSEKHDGLR